MTDQKQVTKPDLSKVMMFGKFSILQVGGFLLTVAIILIILHGIFA